MSLLRLLALFISFFAIEPAFAAQTLRFSAASSWNMPFGRFESDQLVEGIMYDIAMAIEKQLQIPVSFVVLPRKRIDAAALSGDIDLRCYMTPQWTEVPDQYVWSGRLFEVSDVIFGAETIPAAHDLRELPTGALVSAVLGYEYPTLDTLFANGQLKREDTSDQEKVNLKLTAGRTPYGISETIALNWYQRITPHHRHAPWRLIISRNDFQCGIPKKGNISPAKILAALEALKKTNQFEKILQKYR